MDINRFRVFVVFLVVLVICFGARAQAQENNNYILNPGDVLEISVWKDEALQKQVLVLPDGKISFPLVGFIDTKGKSAEDVQKIVSEKLTEYISNPVVTVSVTSVGGNLIYVIGKVNNPGVFPIQQPTDVMQALSLGGGLNSFADEDDILILRRTEKGQITIPFEYSEVSEGKKLETNILLKSGDIVVVP